MPRGFNRRGNGTEQGFTSISSCSKPVNAEPASDFAQNTARNHRPLETHGEATFKPTSLDHSASSSLTSPQAPTQASSQPQERALMAPAGGRINIPNFNPTKYGRPSSTKNFQRPHDDDDCLQQQDQASTQQPPTMSSGPASELGSSSSRRVWSPDSARALVPSRPSGVIASSSQQQRHYERTMTPPADDRNLEHPSLGSGAGLQSTVTAAAAILNEPKTPLISKDATADQHETPEEVLKRVQAASMQVIGYRNRSKGSSSTTSLKDLELARRPLPPNLRNTPRSKLDSVPETPSTETAEAAKSEMWLQGKADTSSGKKGEEGRSKKGPAERGLSEITLPLWGTSQTAADSNPRTQEMGNNVSSVWHLPIKPLPQDTDKSPNPRWATTAEIKPIVGTLDTDSNAWGSNVPSDAATESGDSVKPMHHGKLLRRRTDSRPEHSLAGWDGKLQPPPVDWNDRPRFNNNTLEFKNGFNNWTKATAELLQPTSADHDFHVIPTETLNNLDLQADGVDMVPRNFTLDYTSAQAYGYKEDDGYELGSIMKECKPIDDSDWDNWGLIDRRIPDNAKIKDETTEDLVQNWNAHNNRRYALSSESNNEGPPEPTSREKLENYRPARNPNRPKANIYLRPAVRTDIHQLTDLYNWHVLNTPRTAEFLQITTSDMRYRFENSAAQRLPFIVAGLRKDTRSSDLGQRDKIVGFAHAQDFTASDYVERISVEVELYVHPDYMNQGIGRCLLDQMMSATDRGHLKKGGYPFHCAPEQSHKFESGGARDVHALVFVVRLWRYPQIKPLVNRRAKSEGGPRNSGAAGVNGQSGTQVENETSENDYEKWIKPWLERWDFEEQGVLKGVATKKGRFLNVAYLVKETKWQPAEGKIPEYVQVKAAGVDEEDDDDEDAY